MATQYAPTCLGCGAANLDTRYCENCGRAAEVVVPAAGVVVASSTQSPHYPSPAPAGAYPRAEPMLAYPAGGGTNTLAVLSLVFALLGGVLLPIIFGHLAKSQIRRSGERGDGLATAGLVIGYLWLIVFVIVMIAIAASAPRY